jgi:hypothetical protein
MQTKLDSYTKAINSLIRVLSEVERAKHAVLKKLHNEETTSQTSFSQTLDSILKPKED